MTEVFSPDVGPRCMPLTGEQELADRVAALEQACGLPALGPLTLEQRVQSLEMQWADIAERILGKVDELNRHLEQMHKDHGERLRAWMRLTDTPAPEVPPT